MSTAAAVTAQLRELGELWEPQPGLVALRGDALALYQALDRCIARIAVAESQEEWRVPPAVSFATLARADYFASFPQWLTAASHLDQDDAELARVAAAPDPASAAVDALRPTTSALQPAVCYHVYAALAGRTLADTTRVTVCGTCWRNEQETFRPLERGWAFTMREVVCAGNATAVEAFRQHGLRSAQELAADLDIAAEVVLATDPFFAPSTRGRRLLQRVKALKHEVLLPLGDGRTVAAASANNHERFFGDAFDIRMTDGAVASTGCVAYGIERWTLAFLVRHGVNRDAWPDAVLARLHGEEMSWAR